MNPCLVSWSREVSSKKWRDSRSRETEVGEKIAATSVQVEFVDDLLLPTQALQDIQNNIMYHLVEKDFDLELK